jgi:AcrR family transcriptional regulator
MRQRRADTADNETRARPPGRPRNPAVDVAILAAAERQLGERGYAGMSLESVAAAAGTTPPSLRRRYQTKLQLATAVIDSLRVQPLPKPTGTPRVDAAEILANFQNNLLRLHGMATVGTILAEEQRNPELLAHFRQHLVEPRRAALHRTLEAAVETGELPATLDLDATVNLLIGSFYACYLRTGTVPRGWAERVLLVIWPPQGSSGRPVGQLPKSAGR